MIKTIVTACITYVSTSLDEIPILFMLYTTALYKGKGKSITLTYFIGTFVLIGAGFLGAFGLNVLPVKWVIGLFGIVPFIMGIKTFLEDDNDEVKALETAEKYNSLWIKVFVITIILGADDLGIYIPLFTTIRGWEIIQVLTVFVVGTTALCFISFKISKISILNSFFEKRGRFIAGSSYILLGLVVIHDFIIKPYFI